MTNNVANFDRQSRDAARKVVAEAEEAIRSMALELFSDLRTDAKSAGGHGAPVASGRLAASMRLEINAIDRSREAADPNYRYPNGSGARPLPPRTIANPGISRTSAKLRRFRIGDTIYVSNTVPYIRRIEDERFSWQTPDGVFGPTVRNIQRKFRNIRLRVRRV
jgi:hypothetical protein